MDTASFGPVLALGATAFLVGLTGAMAPGPLLTVTVTETVRRGRLAALSLLLGHAALEALLIIGFAFGLETVLRLPVVIALVGVVGGAFLLWMGGSLLVGAARGTLRLDLDAEAKPSRLGPVVRGAAVSLSNPYWTLWWATVGVVLALKGLALGPIGIVAFFVGHEMADVAWYGLVVVAVSSGRHLLSDAVYRVIMAACAAFLVYLGGSFLYASLAGGVHL